MRYRAKSATLSERTKSSLGRIIVLTGARQTGKTTLVKHMFPDYPYRFAATRSWRFLPQMFIRRTNVCATTKLSYEALNRQFFVGAVRCWRSVHRACKPWWLLSCRVIKCRLCVAYFFIFFKALEIFFNSIFFWVGFVSSFKNFGCAVACAVFKCACKSVGYLTIIAIPKPIQRTIVTIKSVLKRDICFVC
jgi:hypothetical protein